MECGAKHCRHGYPVMQAMHRTARPLSRGLELAFSLFRCLNHDLQAKALQMLSSDFYLIGLTWLEIQTAGFRVGAGGHVTNHNNRSPS